MSQRTQPRLPKLPFVFADIVLLGVAYLVFRRSEAPMTPWDMVFCSASVSLGAVLSGPDVVARSLQTPEGYARRSRLVRAKNPSPQTCSYL